MSKETMAYELGLSKRGILKILEELIKKGWLIKDEETKFLKTSSQRYNEFVIYGEKSTPGVQKGKTIGEQSAPPSVNKVHHTGEQSAPNNNIYNKKDNNNTSKEVQQSGTPPEIIEPLNEKKETEKNPPSPADPPLKKGPRIDIQELIYDIQKECEKNGIAYNTDKEREFARHILTAKQFAQFAERVGKTPHQMAISVLKASIQIGYWKGATSGPRSIYKEYAEVYNAWIQQNHKKPLSPIGKLC